MIVGGDQLGQLDIKERVSGVTFASARGAELRIVFEGDAERIRQRPYALGIEPSERLNGAQEMAVDLSALAEPNHKAEALSFLRAALLFCMSSPVKSLRPPQAVAAVLASAPPIQVAR
ncbi:MAG: hypothetical protein IPO80_12930 [Propionibacteriaceae bacterium]|nr:hypothetical protein [Propionibacteriaceae bacterium]